MTGAVWRPLLVYAVLLVLFRSSGKRTLAKTTTFDFVLLLIISEAVSSALLADDHSITGALIAVMTLIVVDLGLSIVRRRWKRIDQLLSYEPTLLIHEGVLLTRNMKREGIDELDILEAARSTRSIVRLADVRYAVLESNGDLSIIAFEPKALNNP
ncbi:MAG: DUF421 domain-containing protein [Gemmatimonadaceae bacterium]|nr:DUF421 domain-containing protein [Gemmatimonadaceae bacterium]